MRDAIPALSSDANAVGGAVMMTTADIDRIHGTKRAPVGHSDILGTIVLIASAVFTLATFVGVALVAWGIV